ncbi:histidine kinase [Fibrella aestuarina BUZ 2]|uniref:histidine kinase n=1 Tax=Fibrella aestuarina BUZ 2 TaxID=1166018 RepID=I0K6I5_9BACT|nr:histidine kinase [Fibrella aestuarina BUZ 2]
MTTPVQLTKLYVATLLSLALLLTVAEVITQWQIDKFQDELWVIRYTALQRNQSQQIAKKVLQLANQHDSVLFVSARNELGSLFKTFERYHIAGRQGTVLGPDGVTSTRSISNSDTVNRLYKAVSPHFIALQVSLNQLLKISGPAQMKSPEAKASIALLLANESLFLEKIDAVIRQYTGELRYKLTRLQRLELIFHILTLLTLAGIGWFVFRPAVDRLRQTLSRLIIAEKRTADVNRKLRSLNKSLKKARQQLYEASQRQLQEQADAQKSRTAYLITGQEEERKRLSRELHDGLGQMLTAIKLQIEGLEVKLSKGRADEVNLATLKNLITQTIQETRSISNNLMPSVLSDFGLSVALRRLAESHNRAEQKSAESAQIEYTVDKEFDSAPLPLDQNVEITLYRVAQESITNAIRHGKARHIRLHLQQQNQQIQFTIEDDGLGFKTQRLTKEPHGQGVHNMHERIKLLNGTFVIHSTPGEGTKISVNIPYHSQLIAHDYDQINVG